MRYLFFFLLITLCEKSIGQDNESNTFNWDVIDTIQKPKEQLYSETKIFIARYWKSAQSVIQNDDKTGGIIIVKGTLKKEVFHSLNTFTYWYNYTVIFRFKENKYRISLTDVYCDKAYPVGQAKYSIHKIQPFDNEYEPESYGLLTSTLSKTKAQKMMLEVRLELDKVVKDYVSYINLESALDDW